jgi:glycerol-3-phosphate dehydrogenase (NAD(P)+)
LSSFKIGVIGCGPWGTAVAKIFAANKHSVEIWCHDDLIQKSINQLKMHPGLKDVVLPDLIKADTNLENVVKNKDYLVFAVASPFIDIVYEIKKYYSGTPILVLTKGLLENKNTLFIPDYIEQVLGTCPLAVLSGPNLALEVASDLPAATVIASDIDNLAKAFQVLVSNKNFRAYTSTDLRGVELGGILKNVIAIAAGLVDGLNLGTNAKSALMTRSVQEIIRFGLKCGARTETFFGLSGIGDLITTCSSSKSRNWTVGYYLSQGKTLEDITAQMVSVAEGVNTAKVLVKLAAEYEVDMPVSNMVYRVLYENKLPVEAIDELMTRNLKPE